MKKKALLILAVLVLVTAVGVTAISAQEKTQPINMELTGSIMNLGEAGSLFDVNLKGTPGSASARGLSFGHPVDYSELPEGNKCVDISGPLDGLIIDNAQMTVLFNDGSMLFGNAADGGYVCFAPGFAYAPYHLVGGTGRFESATGYLNFHIDTHSIGSPGSPVTPETGTGTGEIVLP